jgi:FkbM family methyltransferase
MLMKPVMSALAPMVAAAANDPRLRRVLFNAIRLERPEIDALLHTDTLRFLAYAFSRRFSSKSQILQDLWVCFETGERRGGFFVEFGATNGLVNSNTWLLEKHYGWRGILAEPNPVWHSDLAINRSVDIEHRCVSSESGRHLDFAATDKADPELSGLVEFADGDHFSGVRSAAEVIKVETISLMDMLAQYNAPDLIDYMSIDTEGSEFEILSNFDFSKYRIELLSVEQNRKTEQKLNSLLENNGFRRVFEEYSQWDGWYVAADRGEGMRSSDGVQS